MSPRRPLRFKRWLPITMIPSATLELSIEQLIDALNKRLFIECARLQTAMPPTSRAQITALTDEVRSLILERNSSDNNLFAGRRSGKTCQGCPARSNFFEELVETRESSPPGGPHLLRYSRLRFRSEADRSLDARLPILAQSHCFRPKELGVDIG